MKKPTVIITDCKYRSSIAAVRALGKAGWNVVGVQTVSDCPEDPPAFYSRYMREKRRILDTVKHPEYPQRLLRLLKEYDHPVLLCVGAASLKAVAEHRDGFAEAADFIIADSSILAQLNDKEVVHRRCLELGIPVPKEYEGIPESYPVIVKPHFGEQFGLKASERYAVARGPKEFGRYMAKMSKYDQAPIVQQKVEGEGMGASLLIDRDGRLISAICHKRIREYPITGGPSTCCESFYDVKLIDKAFALLSSFGFTGMAMVEFKGGYLLEVNPRIWGSYPLTVCAKSNFTENYARAAMGETLDYIPCDYETGVRMRFKLNDTLAAWDYLAHFKFGRLSDSLVDAGSVCEALTDPEDPEPMKQYMKSAVRRILP